MLDTRELPPPDRLEALNAAVSNTEVPTVHTYSEVDGHVGHRVEVWELGTGCHLNRIAGTGMDIARGPKQVRISAPERVGLSLQSGSPGRFTHHGVDQVIHQGDFALTDGTSPSKFNWTGIAKAETVVFDYAQLGVPIESARAAAPRLKASPIYNLVRGHVTDMFQLGDDLDLRTAQALKAATIDLVRALIVTAANPDEYRGREVLDQVAYHRVFQYLRTHLTDPRLSPENVARALGLSVRQLYRIWSGNEVPLAEWIIHSRLEVARRELARADGDVSIAGVATRCGFTDTAHFARRFRQAYGQSPREWRQTQAGASPSPGRWRWQTATAQRQALPDHPDRFPDGVD